MNLEGNLKGNLERNLERNLRETLGEPRDEFKGKSRGNPEAIAGWGGDKVIRALDPRGVRESRLIER